MFSKRGFNLHQEQPVSHEQSFADLYGRLRDQVQTSEEEIDAVLYRLPAGSEG